MTVCIAAICKNLGRIVFVTDHLLSSEVAATDGPPKYGILSQTAPWVAMYAARDSRYVHPLLRRIQNFVKDDSLDSVVAACRAGYREQLQEIHEAEVLWPYGMTRPEFYEHGLLKLGEPLFAQVVARLEQVHTGVTMLVAGFDPAGAGHLAEVSEIGAVVEQQLGFHAVGSGSYAALSALFPISGFAHSRDFSEIVYRVLAAKFSAESVPGVGQSTFAFTIGRVVSSWE